MTPEEAKKIIKQFRDRQGNSDDDVEALDMAIKALEQQPNDDYISREEAIGIVAHIKGMHINDREQYQINYGTICDIDLALQHLPSITPKQKTGKWIFHKPFDNGRKNCNECIECSQCHIWLNYDFYAKTPYCPICGADMRGEEE